MLGSLFYLNGTNRDINATQEITRDQTTGMLDGSVTIDHRLLTESGRAEIIQQQKDLPENFRQSAENLAKALPEGEYKDKALQTLNNIQARLNTALQSNCFHATVTIIGHLNPVAYSVM